MIRRCGESLRTSLASRFQIQIREATKKAGGSTKNGRDSPGQRLGVKKFGGEAVNPGSIIIRQRGQKVRAGTNVRMGRDHTIYATCEGFVKFNWNLARKRQVVSVQKENPNPPKLNRASVTSAM